MKALVTKASSIQMHIVGDLLGTWKERQWRHGLLAIGSARAAEMDAILDAIELLIGKHYILLFVCAS